MTMMLLMVTTPLPTPLTHAWSMAGRRAIRQLLSRRACFATQLAQPAQPAQPAQLTPAAPSTNPAATASRANSLLRLPDPAEIERHRFSVAPMMDFTNRYQRMLMRQITKRAVLYSEMVSTNAIVNSVALYRELEFDPEIEGDVVLQIGGSDLTHVPQVVQHAKAFGYRDININSGCPSERVAMGCFGASLMLDPLLVGQLAAEFHHHLGYPPTVKCRIGVNNQDSLDFLLNYISIVSRIGGVNHFQLHARKAILNMRLSPDQNRRIPPLNYPRVYEAIRAFPKLQFTINGGIETYEEIEAHFAHGVHGVMVGRAVTNQPFYWSGVDSKIYGAANDPGLTRLQLIERYANYIGDLETRDRKRPDQKVVVSRTVAVKPLHNLFAMRQGTRAFKVGLDKTIRTSLPLKDVILKALEKVPIEVLNEPILSPPPTPQGLPSSPSNFQKEDLTST